MICVIIVLSCFAMLRVEGCLNSTLQQYSWNPLDGEPGMFMVSACGEAPKCMFRGAEIQEPAVANPQNPRTPRPQSLPTQGR